MKIIIVENSAPIEPFNDKASELLIGLQSLGDLQQKYIKELGYTSSRVEDVSEVSESGPYVLVGSHVYFEKALLKEFVKRSQANSSKSTCAVTEGIFTVRSVVAVQNLERRDDLFLYDLHFVPSGASHSDSSTPVVFDLNQKPEGLNVPRHMIGKDRYEVPFSEMAIVQIDHWASLWTSNLIHILCHLASFQKTNVGKFLWSAIRQLSFNKWKVLSGVNVVGRNCDIHKTAYLEGCVLGDNVTIGAGSVVRHAMLGSGVTLGNGITIENCVLGEKAVVLHGHIANTIMLAESLSVTNFISACMIGRRCFVGGGSALADFRFDGRDMLLRDSHGKVVDSQNTFLGGCLGHDVYLGAGCVIGPGRSVPNGSRVSLTNRSIVSAVGQETGEEAYQVLPGKDALKFRRS